MIGTAYLNENGRVERVRVVLELLRKRSVVVRLVLAGVLLGWCSALWVVQAFHAPIPNPVALNVCVVTINLILVVLTWGDRHPLVELRPLAVTPRRGPPIPWTAIAEVRCVEDIRRRGRSWSILVVAPDGAATPLIRRAFRSSEDAAPFVELLRRFPQSDEAERRRLVDGLTLRFPRGYRGGIERSVSAG